MSRSTPKPPAASAGLRGLSLQEMLIVIAVFIILAVVLVVSSTQVMVDARISRVKQDQKQLANALTRYRIEFSNFPSTLVKLMAPNAYLEKLPKDPFSTDQVNSQYTYYPFSTSANTNRRYALIVSAGPDGDVDFQPISAAAMGASGGPGGPGGDTEQSGESPDLQNWIRAQVDSLAYDPTNGSHSNGDCITLVEF